MSRRLATLTIVSVALATMIILSLTGCGSPEPRTGSIAFRVASEGAKSILPPISMTVTRYVVEGAGPGGATFGPQELTGDTTVADFLPGEWTFTVHGLNAAGDDIGSGTAIANVVVGQTASCAIVVYEYTAATGGMSITLAWEPDIVGDPVWTGVLSRNSVDENLTFNIDALNCTATTEKNFMTPGWYALVTKLYDAPTGLDGSQVFSTGAATAVRIATARQTVGTVNVHAVQGFGNISFDFSLDFNDPLTLTPSDPFGPISMHSGNSKTFTISANKTSAFAWYLDGQLLDVGSSFTLAADSMLDGQNYRLDVLGFSADGKSGGSGTWIVQRTSMPDEAYGIAVTAHSVVDQTVHFKLYNLDGTTAATFSMYAPASTLAVHIFALLSEASYKVEVWSTAENHIFYGGTNFATATAIAVPVLPAAAVDCGFLY